MRGPIDFHTAAAERIAPRGRTTVRGPSPGSRSSCSSRAVGGDSSIISRRVSAPRKRSPPTSGMSDRAIAEKIGVNNATVSRARKRSSVAEATVEKRVGKDGNARKMP
jgi:hypothetical protein